MLRLLILAVCALLDTPEEVAVDDRCDIVQTSDFDRNGDGRIDRVEERKRSRHCEEGIVPFA